MSEITAQGTAPFITGPGNVLSGLKRICLFALGFVIAIDLAHSTLSAVYDPYSGAVDDAMHIVLFAAPAFYVTALFFMLNRLVVVYQCSGWRVLPVVAILVVLGELAFTFLAARRSGSSFYRPMFPDFAAGLIIGGLTAAAAKPYLQSRAMRIFLTALLLLWLGGTIVTDLLWYSEGTQRGTGPLWRIPVLGHLMMGLAFVIMYAGNLGNLLLYGWFPAEPFSIGVWMVVALVLGWFLWRNTRDRAVSICASLSLAVLGFKLVEWASFIAD